ncbi:MAG: hypothetical protein ACYTBV_11860 [Planctomycetota bacterium]
MTKGLPERYEKFDDLPNHIKAAIDRLQLGDSGAFVRRKIPQLTDRSIIDILNAKGEDGESEVLEFIYRLRGMFG